MFHHHYVVNSPDNPPSTHSGDMEAIMQEQHLSPTPSTFDDAPSTNPGDMEAIIKADQEKRRTPTRLEYNRPSNTRISESQEYEFTANQRSVHQYIQRVETTRIIGLEQGLSHRHLMELLSQKHKPQS